MVKHVIAFNFAVWKFRLPAAAAKLERTEDWLVSRLTELARSYLSACPGPKPKKRRSLDPFTDVSLHNHSVLSAPPDAALCYTDGSASPNPGPSGAGISFFLPSHNLIIDLGASLGLGTNNAAEIHALGSALHFIPSIISSFNIKHFFIFSDSKLALNATCSKHLPLVNRDATLLLRKIFREVNSSCSLYLKWVRGHSAIGGNERVDRIAKIFASAPLLPNTPGPYTFHYFQHYHPFSFFCPLVDLPASFFIRNLPVPPSAGLVSRDSSDELDFKHSD
jgi:ribonuclease HI